MDGKCREDVHSLRETYERIFLLFSAPPLASLSLSLSLSPSLSLSLSYAFFSQFKYRNNLNLHQIPSPPSLHCLSNTFFFFSSSIFCIIYIRPWIKSQPTTKQSPPIPTDIRTYTQTHTQTHTHAHTRTHTSVTVYTHAVIKPSGYQTS